MGDVHWMLLLSAVAGLLGGALVLTVWMRYHDSTSRKLERKDAALSQLEITSFALSERPEESHSDRELRNVLFNMSRVARKAQGTDFEWDEIRPTDLWKTHKECKGGK